MKENVIDMLLKLNVYDQEELAKLADLIEYIETTALNI